MKKTESLLKNILEILLPAIILAFIIDTFLFMPVKVTGTSMFPYLIDGDFGFSFIFSKVSGFDRFDTVVVDNGEKLIVKRLIGMPNETLEYKDNKLYINGEYVSEPFLVDTHTNDFEVKLGEDEYYCLGDNRMVSKDSRVVGAFTKEDIKAKHVLILFPFDRFGYKE